MSAMPDSLDIEMDCSICGRFCSSAICPVCAAASAGDTSAAKMLGPDQWLEVVREAIPLEETMPEIMAKHVEAIREAVTPIGSTSETVLGLDTGRVVDEPSEFGATDPEDLAPVNATLVDELTAIAAAGLTNAAVQGAGSMAGGQLASVGFRTQDGYITAIRNGVPAHTHREYLNVLRDRFKLSGSALAKLALPGPMVIADLPVGKGILHDGIIPTKATLKPFVVGPAAAERPEVIRTTLDSKELVAGAAAEGHHAIVAWMGTSQTTRGKLVEALTSIGRESWAPRAPNARAQAGSSIAALARNGLDVRAERKGETTELASGEHVWTVGRVNHAGQVGSDYGKVLCRFHLAGSTLAFSGDETIGAPVVAAFTARMAAETLKSGDVTSWLTRTMARELRAVRFGALGFLIPARHVAAAKALCNAVAAAPFGTGWVDGLPVATSDQLRDGIVRGLTDEVDTILERLASERETARSAKAEATEAAMFRAEADSRHAQAAALSGDIGPKRVETFLRDLRDVAGRIVAYGQVLGAERVANARDAVRKANIELETLRGEDYEGISARFSAVWDEIEHDAKRKGEVL